jgi:hypothetical protein
MLGPNDVADWSTDLDERLASDLRRHPGLRVFIKNPGHPLTMEAMRLSPLIARFLRQEILSLEELQTLRLIVGPR